MSTHPIEDRKFSRNLSSIFGIIFIASGFIKLLGLFAFMKNAFDAGGLPIWLYYGVSIIEILAGVMLFTKYRKLDLLLMTILLVGSIYIYYKNTEAGILLIPSFVCAIFIGMEIVSEFKNDDEE
jgi:uncharacterized membrane protein YphA (DoxX/SURF4 family)